MGKRKASGLLDELFEIATWLPWWAGCVLAVVAYLLLHHVAGADGAHVNSTNQLSNQITGPLFKGIAAALQYAVPIPLLAGAMASAFGRSRRKRLIQEVAVDRTGETLRSMSWQDFERLTGEAFRLRGYAVTETGGGGADGGMDLKLRRNGETYLVQCKQWRAYKVSVDVVRELYGVMTAEGASGGFVVAPGVFTDPARAFALGRNIELIDGSALRRMIDDARASLSIASTDRDPAIPSRPSCPLCNRPMVQRTARRGTHAGSVFWGCTSYPQCKGVRSIELGP